MTRYKIMLITAVALLTLIITACGAQTPSADTITSIPIPETQSAIPKAIPPKPSQIAELSFPKNSDGYSDISVIQLDEILKYKNFTLINTHVPYAGDIPQTDLSIPFDQLDTYADQLPADKNAPLAVYCRSGSMSTQAAQTLVAMGYTNVWEIDGGMNAWQNAGYELVMNQ